MPLSPEEEEAARWHEAGHAAVAQALGWHVGGVYACDIDLEPPAHIPRGSDQYYLDRITICYAGEFGQALGGFPAQGPELAGDRQLIHQYAEILTKRGHPPDLSELRRKAEKLVTCYAPAVKAVAQALREGNLEEFYDDYSPHRVMDEAMAGAERGPGADRLGEPDGRQGDA